MPTYDYVCRKCGHVFEVFQVISEQPLRTCPLDVCPLESAGKGTGPVERRIGAGGALMFKGSGFYETDYKKRPAKTGGGGTGEKKRTDTKGE